MPGNSACWEQESAWCEEMATTTPNRRSRKQRMPRRIMTTQDCDVEETTAAAAALSVTTKDEPETPRKAAIRRFRCWLCPKSAPARASRSKPYHSRKSLMLHKLWRHNRRRFKSSRATEGPAITLRATVYCTKRAFDYQR